ncbi:hypothetical protein GOBAR_AA33576 [Gossypium barbadense]|uniref:Uncharacterized protein n=1 Tax=Gossypium barbadense TaxID=3634 RepID=A0A2P5W7P4_GOSBA|nr:hypothetical protein GOBAR_AA33576 [Gossypium barbadense]
MLVLWSGKEDGVVAIEGEAKMAGLTKRVLKAFKSWARVSMVIIVVQVEVLVWFEGSSMLVVSFPLIGVEEWFMLAIPVVDIVYNKGRGQEGTKRRSRWCNRDQFTCTAESQNKDKKIG